MEEIYAIKQEEFLLKCLKKGSVIHLEIDLGSITL